MLMELVRSLELNFNEIEGEVDNLESSIKLLSFDELLGILINLMHKLTHVFGNFLTVVRALSHISELVTGLGCSLDELFLAQNFVTAGINGNVFLVFFHFF